MRLNRKFTIIFLISLAISIVSLILLSKISSTNNSQDLVIEESTMVRIYLVKPDDNGVVGKKIGCGDRLVYVSEEVIGEDLIKATIEKLLETKQVNNEGLYSAFENSNLIVEKIKYKDQVAFVYLTGSLELSGVCDNPRIENQLRSTVLQFSNISQVEVFVNGVNLEEILSQK